LQQNGLPSYSLDANYGDGHFNSTTVNKKLTSAQENIKLRNILNEYKEQFKEIKKFYGELDQIDLEKMNMKLDQMKENNKNLRKGQNDLKD
jgi:hypothetical protein